MSKFQIQSVLFKKSKYKSNPAVRKVTKKNKWKSTKIETKSTWNYRRARQQDPSKFKKSTLRVKDIGQGIKLIIGQRR